MEAAAKTKKINAGPCSFKSYAHQLTIDELPILNKDGKTLEVKCTYCGKHFIPCKNSISNRIRSLKRVDYGESRLYCSDECKSECPVYRSQGSNHTSSKLTREIIPALRQAVFSRDGYRCIKCGSDEYLHCHHEIPVKADPGKSEDTDNCFTLCKKCHIEVHNETTGCGYGELRKLKNKCKK